MRRLILLFVLICLPATAVACQGTPPTPAPTAVPPTSVPAPTAVPPTAAPPTATRMPPTPTAVPPTVVPATQTPPAPTVPPAPTARPTSTGIAQNTSLSSFTTSHFSGSGNCVTCHSPLKDQAGVDVSPAVQWRGTTKANAATDPLWQAKVASEVKRVPGLQAVIEEKCANCHMPMAEIQAKADGGKALVLGQGFLDPKHPLHDAAMDGVSCTLCHQITAKDLGQKASFSGGYQIDTTTAAPNRILYGPFKDQNVQIKQGTTGFIPTYAAHFTDSALCATCHNLYTPFVDATGKVVGEFPEQTPYTEWQNSSFVASKTTCQTCHMPAAKGALALSTMPPGLPTREPFGQHEFAGANPFILTILRDNGKELGVMADAEHFNAAIADAQASLGKRSATLAVKSLEQKGDNLVAQLQVTPLTGHKFPTSFPSRRAWLHVAVTDAAGKVIFESGQPKADGSITGNDADADPAKIEPHYDVVTKPDQVQIYEAIMGDTDGKVTYTLLRGAKFLKDNRVLPAGFDKAKAIADIAVYGEAAKDENFVGGGDLVTFQVEVKGATGPFTVNAELLFQPVSFRFVQDLLADKTELTDRFGKYYAAADKTPTLIAKIEAAKTK